MSEASELLSANLEAAHRVGERLVYARAHLSDVLPLEQGAVTDRLSEDTAVWIDAFLKRWESFQDLIEGQLARGLVIVEGESDHVVTRRDRAQFLEKLGLVDASEAWFDAGQLHNQLAHSYPLSNPKQIRRVNAAYERTGLLIDTFNRIRDHVRTRGLATVAVEALPRPKA